MLGLVSAWMGDPRAFCPDCKRRESPLSERPLAELLHTFAGMWPTFLSLHLPPTHATSCSKCWLTLHLHLHLSNLKYLHQPHIFAQWGGFCFSHACNLSPILCWRPVENGVIANMFAWRQLFQPWKRGFCIQDGICFRKQESCILPAYLRNVSLDPVAHFYLRRSQQVNRSQIYLFFFSSSWQVPNWRP